MNHPIPELDHRFWTSSVVDIIDTIECNILACQGPTDLTLYNHICEMWWQPLHDAILDAGFDCGAFLHWISENKKVPYIWDEKHWMWFVPHQNNTMDDYNKALAALHCAIPIDYKLCRTPSNECACHCKSLKEALTRVFALDPNNLPSKDELYVPTKDMVLGGKDSIE